MADIKLNWPNIHAVRARIPELVDTKAEAKALRSRLVDQPVAMTPGRLSGVLYRLEQVAAGPTAFTAGGHGLPDVRPYAVIDGAAVIEIHGDLFHRGTGNPFLDAWFGIRSYDSIAAELDAALADGEVERILLHVDSPGGEVSGAFDLADKIYAARDVKPIVAVAEDMAASAGYLLASSAGSCFVTQSGITGSIGIVCARLDASEYESRAGIRLHVVTSGARKADGTPSVPFSDDERAALEAHIAEYFDLFVEKVARNRGLSDAAIRGLEAGIFVGSTGLELGLVDGVATASQILEQAVDVASASQPNTNQETGMSRVCPVKAGENLGRVLNDAIAEQESDERTREAIVGELAESAGVEADRVEGIASGEIACPEMAELEGLAEGLGVEVSVLVEAAEADGCEYPDGSEDDATSDDEEEMTAEGTGPDAKRRIAAPNKEARMSAREKKLQAELEAAKASLAAVEEREKARVITTHAKAGRVVPSMRKAIDKLAEVMTVEELDTHLAAFPVVTHAAPTGEVDGEAPAKTDDKLVSRALGISLETIRRFGDVESVSCDGKYARLIDGTVIETRELGGRA